MAVWIDSANTAHYSFSSNGTIWKKGLISSSQGNVANQSDVFVAGNATGFVVTWVDNANNAWSSFSSNNGSSWSEAVQINPNSLSMDPSSDVFVAGGPSGFVAVMVGSDDNIYVSFSTQALTWSMPTEITLTNPVFTSNLGSQTGRGFVSAVIAGNGCMLTWIGQTLSTYSAYFSSINPFSSTTIYPILSVGFFESSPIVAQLNGYFANVCRANQEINGQTYIAVCTIPSNWADFSPFTTNTDNQNAGPWVAANQAGFMTTWSGQGSPGTPVWMLTANNGFNQTPVCSILATPSTTITGLIALSANTQGFVASWIDTNDNNAYATFYYAPPNAASSNQFVALLEQKYGPLL
jgi:hypothetical protein